MKKILFLLIIFMLSNSSFALDYSQYCSTNSAKKDFLGAISSVSGINFLTRNIIEHEITKALKDETGTKFKINLENFFSNSLVKGEFKSIKGEGKDLIYNGYYISNVNFSSLCDYNYVNYEDDKLIFKENLVLNFDAKVTQEDLNKYLANSEYKKVLDKLSNDKTISSLFKINDGNIQILDNKLKFNYEIKLLPKNNLDFLQDYIKPINVSYSANLRVKDNKLELFDFDFNQVKIAQNYLLPLINKVNPTVFDIKIDKNQKGKLDIQNIKIEKSQILLNGVLFIPHV